LGIIYVAEYPTRNRATYRVLLHPAAGISFSDRIAVAVALSKYITLRSTCLRKQSSLNLDPDFNAIPTMTTTNGVSPAGGGFMQPSALSPASSASTVTPSVLPKQRTHPIRPGSMKEATVINYVDKMILAINRRHAKKFSSVLEQQPTQQNGNETNTKSASNREREAGGEKERGYESFKEVVKDIESVVDVLWVSGTRMFPYYFRPPPLSSKGQD
jgi:hypothetical protein